MALVVIPGLFSYVSLAVAGKKKGGYQPPFEKSVS